MATEQAATKATGGLSAASSGFNVNGTGNRPTSNKKRRAGLMKALIGSNHMVDLGGVSKVKGAAKPKGKVRGTQYAVKDISQHQDAKGKAICLACHETWDSLSELTEEHDNAALVEAGEPHVVAFFSTDPDPEYPESGRILGLLSDEWAPIAQ